MIATAVLEEIYSNIEKTKGPHRNDQSVQIVAVTKTRPFSAIEEIYSSGILSIGENRVQEAANKFQSFDQDLQTTISIHLDIYFVPIL